MTITTNRIEATEPTEAEIESAILAALTPSGENLMPWAKVRDRLPGEYWDQAYALWRLYQSGRVCAAAWELSSAHGRGLEAANHCRVIRLSPVPVSAAIVVDTSGQPPLGIDRAEMYLTTVQRHAVAIAGEL
jgi:hypothetical protein